MWRKWFLNGLRWEVYLFFIRVNSILCSRKMLPNSPQCRGQPSPQRMSIVLRLKNPGLRGKGLIFVGMAFVAISTTRRQYKGRFSQLPHPRAWPPHDFSFSSYISHPQNGYLRVVWNEVGGEKQNRLYVNDVSCPRSSTAETLLSFQSSWYFQCQCLALEMKGH